MKNRRKFIKSASLIAASAGTLGYHFSQANNIITSIKSKTKKSMLHNVYFWIKDDVNESERKKFEQGIKDFVSAVKEIHKVEFGVPAPTEDREVVDHSFDYVMFVWFKNINDHNIYQKHPAHKKFIDDYSMLWERVKVYDSDLI